MNPRFQICLVFIALNIAFSASLFAQPHGQPPSPSTMRLGDFYLGMPISEIRDLVSRSIYKLTRSIYRLNDSNSARIQQLISNQYPKTLTLKANKLDSIPCLGNGNTFADSSNCVFFDQVLVRLDDSTNGVYALIWIATKFNLDSISRLQRFADAALQYLTRIFGNPHQIESDLSMITVERLRNFRWSTPFVYLGKWEWRDEVDRYHMVIRDVSIYYYRVEDGTFVLSVQMGIPLLDDE